MRPLCRAVHAAAVHFERKHTPVRQTRRPQSAFEPVEQPSVCAWAAQWQAALFTKTKTRLDSEPDGT